jgi:hypothetical protein
MNEKSVDDVAGKLAQSKQIRLTRLISESDDLVIEIISLS